MIEKNSKIFVAGHNGLVGSAIVRKLKEKGFKNILTINRSKLDLTNQILSFISVSLSWHTKCLCPLYLFKWGSVVWGFRLFRHENSH